MSRHRKKKNNLHTEQSQNAIKQNFQWPTYLVELPPESWKDEKAPPNLIRVLRSRKYLVQINEITPDKLLMMGISRIANFKIDAKLVDHITWPELQTLKREAGYHDKCAVEIYPPDGYIADTGARHLWIYLQGVPYFMFGKEQYIADQPKIILPGA
jgi:hypothetical protein